MISNTTIGNPGTTLSCAIRVSAGFGQGSGVGRTVELANEHVARGRRIDDGKRPFVITVPMYAVARAAKKPQTYVPPPPPERSP
ncbi:MAG TPA: hypothetical protein VJ870_19010 [Amycolatopsis sp.]|nr:hypothetical protein [Amycolatopsis sp.]